MKTILTDAGRNIAHPTETRDCTVRALAAAAGVTYETAHAALAAAGRRDRRGVKLSKVIAAGKLPGFAFRRIGRSLVTVRKFLRLHPSGRFLCRKSCHAFAVVDGTIHDNFERRDLERITHAWTVEARP